MRSPARPKIMVSAMPAFSDRTAHGLTEIIHSLDRAAREAITSSGGQVIRAPATAGEALLQEVTAADAVVLLGGGDIDPVCYGAGERHPDLYNVNRESDACDLALYHAAKDLGLPVLAICRGLHIVNVAHGGTLLQHIDDGAGIRHRNGEGDPMVNHTVSLAPASALSSILQCGQLTVRSGHHQAVDRVGNGLRVAGWAHDGIVEALEGTDSTAPTICVQWHPEDLGADTSHRDAIFAWLASTASQRVNQVTHGT